MDQEECNMKKNVEKKKKGLVMSSLMFVLYSMIVIMFGALVITYWHYKYHPTNSNLWMVPIGLILVATPSFLSLSVLISDLCDHDDDEDDHQQQYYHDPVINV
ncbi:unnamed protein product [Cochlearia groenlandica]